MHTRSRRAAWRARGALALCLAGCAAASPSGDDASAADAGVDASNAFGNAVAGSAGSGPMLTLIEDGGAGVLPDGAIVYLALWARPCPANSTSSYENFGAVFFQNYCLRCHDAARQGTARNGAPEDVNFGALDDIRVRKERIFALAADDNTLMPAAGAPPSSTERHRLGDWLACGAP